MGNLIVMRGLMNFNVAQNLGACCIWILKTILYEANSSKGIGVGREEVGLVSNLIVKKSDCMFNQIEFFVYSLLNLGCWRMGSLREAFPFLFLLWLCKNGTYVGN